MLTVQYFANHNTYPNYRYSLVITLSVTVNGVGLNLQKALLPSRLKVYLFDDCLT